MNIIVAAMFLFGISAYFGWRIGAGPNYKNNKRIKAYVASLEHIARLTLAKDVFENTDTYKIKQLIKKNRIKQRIKEKQKEIDEIQK